MRRRFRMLASGFFLVAYLCTTAIARSGTSVRQTPSASPTLSPFEAGLRGSYSQLSAAGAASRNAIASASEINPELVIAIGAQNGFQRLDDSAVMTLLHLRAHLVMHAGQHTCADFWTDRHQEDAITIEALPPGEQQQWAELVVEAALATLRNRPIRPPPVADAVRLAILRLFHEMPPPDQLEMLDLTNISRNPDPAERCQGVRLFYGQLDKMDRSDALMVMRSLLYN